MMRIAGAGLAAMALVGMAVPAAAEDRKPRRHHRDRADKVDAGDIALGALLIGGVLAIAASGKKRSGPADYAPPLDTVAVTGAALDADGAADVCAQAAETQGTRLARVVRVDRISAVEAADDGWVARGMLVLRDSWRESGDARQRGFRCAVAGGGVPQVTFDGEELAAR